MGWLSQQKRRNNRDLPFRVLSELYRQPAAGEVLCSVFGTMQSFFSHKPNRTTRKSSPWTQFGVKMLKKKISLYFSAIVATQQFRNLSFVLTVLKKIIDWSVFCLIRNTRGDVFRLDRVRSQALHRFCASSNECKSGQTEMIFGKRDLERQLGFFKCCKETRVLQFLRTQLQARVEE